jgi:hypothetical protein
MRIFWAAVFTAGVMAACSSSKAVSHSGIGGGGGDEPLSAGPGPGHTTSTTSGGQVCGSLVGPNLPSTCTLCAGAGCQLNGCGKGQWCESTTKTCVPPPGMCGGNGSSTASGFGGAPTTGSGFGGQSSTQSGFGASSSTQSGFGAASSTGSVPPTSASSGGGSCVDAPGPCNGQSDCLQCAILGPCKSQTQACMQVPDCNKYATCVQACAANDSACKANCQQMSPAGYAPYEAVIHCAVCQTCPMECMSSPYFADCQ